MRTRCNPKLVFVAAGTGSPIMSMLESQLAPPGDRPTRLVWGKPGPDDFCDLEVVSNWLRRCPALRVVLAVEHADRRWTRPGRRDVFGRADHAVSSLGDMQGRLPRRASHHDHGRPGCTGPGRHPLGADSRRQLRRVRPRGKDHPRTTRLPSTSPALGQRACRPTGWPARPYPGWCAALMGTAILARPRPETPVGEVFGTPLHLA